MDSPYQTVSHRRKQHAKRSGTTATDHRPSSTRPWRASSAVRVPKWNAPRDFAEIERLHFGAEPPESWLGFGHPLYLPQGWLSDDDEAIWYNAAKRWAEHHSIDSTLPIIAQYMNFRLGKGWSIGPLRRLLRLGFRIETGMRCAWLFTPHPHCTSGRSTVLSLSLALSVSVSLSRWPNHNG
jgi:hypothetical protein